jgi:hypothetical protein
LTTYTFKDPDSVNLKIVLAADIDRTLNPSAPLAVGYTMFDDKGKLVAGRVERASEATLDQKRKLQIYMGAAIAPPGTYTVKLAVADETGKRGSVERTITAKINGFGQLHASDLMIADSGMQAGRGLPAAVGTEFTGDELHGFVELVSEVPDQLRSATVIFEVAKDENGHALDSAAARIQLIAGGDQRRIAEAGVPIALLPPGEYVARAVISVNGRRVGQLVRPFRISERKGV